MRHILSFIVLLLVSNVVSAQINIDSFYQDGTEWDEAWFMNWGQGSASNEFYILKIIGDTNINGYNYHKLYYSKAGAGHLNQSNYSYTTAVLNFKQLGGIRTENKKVYFLYTDTVDDNNNLPDFDACLRQRFVLGAESILYDFDLAVGDTVSWRQYDKYVVNLDTIPVGNNVNVKTYYFPSPTGERWLEGIGSASGFLFSGGLVNVWGIFGTVCYRSPLTEYHYDPPRASVPQFIRDFCFRTLTEVKNVNNDHEHDIVIYPNPMENDRLMLQGETSEVVRYEVYDVTGRKRTVASGTANSSSLYVPVPQGFYFLKIYFKDNTVLTKPFSKI